jgi:ribosomal protein L13E
MIEKDRRVIGGTCIAYIREVKSMPKKTKSILLDEKVDIKPMVKGGKRIRKGKGFSKGELLEAGIEVKDVKHLNIPYDKRRKTVHRHNVETLKALLEVKANGNRST